MIYHFFTYFRNINGSHLNDLFVRNLLKSSSKMFFLCYKFYEFEFINF